MNSHTTLEPGSSGARSLDELLLVLISEGTPVSTPDGPYGSIRELIVNPYDNLATHVVIQPTTGGPGRLVAVDRLTPTPAAVFVDLDEIGFSECASVDVHGSMCTAASQTTKRMMAHPHVTSTPFSRSTPSNANHLRWIAVPASRPQTATMSDRYSV